LLLACASNDAPADTFDVGHDDARDGDAATIDADSGAALGNADYEGDIALAPWDALDSYRFGGGPPGELAGATIDPVVNDLVHTALDRDAELSSSYRSYLATGP
jgi:hypothetical protein